MTPTGKPRWRRYQGLASPVRCQVGDTQHPCSGLTEPADPPTAVVLGRSASMFDCKFGHRMALAYDDLRRITGWVAVPKERATW